MPIWFVISTIEPANIGVLRENELELKPEPKEDLEIKEAKSEAALRDEIMQMLLVYERPGLESLGPKTSYGESFSCASQTHTCIIAFQFKLDE